MLAESVMLLFLSSSEQKVQEIMSTGQQATRKNHPDYYQNKDWCGSLQILSPYSGKFVFFLAENCISSSSTSLSKYRYINVVEK